MWHILDEEVYTCFVCKKVALVSEDSCGTQLGILLKIRKKLL
jgi:hypothetical protein